MPSNEHSTSPHQAGYWGHWLTLEGDDEDALAQTLASAKVDLNPHQVEAALFALRSPMARGALLADEVGLGKTIEASLVLAQKWAERRRRLLLIVPASLRKQWSQELLEKFSLPALILEARNFREAMRAGADNPFEAQAAFGADSVVICSYEFAARQHEKLGAVGWDLVVLDEAHKLRGIYKGGADSAKTARRLNDALAGRSKLLLSATPLQNNLQELYGLVSIIDPHFFGGLEAFKVRYCGPRVARAELEALRERLKSIVTRTLRRQVQQEGGIRFTRRYSLTEDFTPSDDELMLYQEVSRYLQDPALLAIKPGARHLVTLVVRKILASSSRAIAGTLDTMIERLESRLGVSADNLADFDTIGDLADTYGTADDAPNAGPAPDPAALRAEIARLKDFRQLAGHIVQDRKADALLRVLDRAFEMTERLGGARKAVIFTESVRTQAWLFELLDAMPAMRGRVVLLNGSNTDTASRAIYQDWFARHGGTARASGSRTADMKAALVDRFRGFEPERNSLMICTEAGAEGINLQFCSLLVNYDLPWNPQRVEQRIGRVHRYGQQHDVVVVNFINRSNLADRRVFELLNLKFKLFEGVFGASDEILGSLESGVDIEQRIHRIYQQCRNDEQIDAEFNALQEELRTELDARDEATQRSLLDHFDADVVQRLKLRRERSGQQLSQYQERLLALTGLQLPEARIDGHRVLHSGVWHDVNWNAAQNADAAFLRPFDGLGAQVIEAAKRGLHHNAGGELLLTYRAVQGQYSDVRSLIGSSGELVVEKLSLVCGSERRERLLSAGRAESGEILDAATCERLLLLPSQVLAQDTAAVSPDLQQRLDEAVRAARAAHEQENVRRFEAEAEKLDRWAEDRRVALDLRMKQLDADIRGARRALRQLLTLQEKINAKREVAKLEHERDDAMLAYHETRKQIEAEEDRLLSEVEGSLHITEHRQRLFAIRWRLQAPAGSDENAAPAITTAAGAA